MPLSKIASADYVCEFAYAMIRVYRTYRPRQFEYAATVPFAYLDTTTFRSDFPAFQAAVNAWWGALKDPELASVNFNLNKHGLEIVVNYHTYGPAVTWGFAPADYMIAKLVQLHVEATPRTAVTVPISRTALVYPAAPPFDVMGLLCGMNMGGVSASSLEITVNKDFLVLTAETL